LSSIDIPSLTAAQAREADRLTWERFRVPVSWLMEAAGWQVARHCRRPSYVLCGKGNNGGDGLAAARHLHRWGLLRGVACTDREGLRGPAAEQAEALEAVGVTIATEPDPTGASLVVDALLGTGLSRPPEGRVREWIEAAARWDLPVVAVDLPSGLDGDAGHAPGACVGASLTVTLGLPKPGLRTQRGRELAGEVWVADIGIPSEAYREVGISVPAGLFAERDLVLLPGPAA
jgi:NAD(P)H-hydrate epimerase